MSEKPSICEAVFCFKQKGLIECISDNCDTCPNNPNAVDIKKLMRENRLLKNRCRVQTQGLLCCFCPMDCENRSEKFKGEDDEDN